MAVEICDKLWTDWGNEIVGSSKRPTQLYTVNIPLVEDLLVEGKRKAVYANMWRSSYGSLFKATTS